MKTTGSSPVGAIMLRKSLKEYLLSYNDFIVDFAGRLNFVGKIFILPIVIISTIYIPITGWIVWLIATLFALLFFKQ